MADPRGQIAAAMAQLIAVREDLMVDECTVTRPADQAATPDLDPATGMPLAGPDDPEVYAGPCTIADPSSALQGHRTVNDEAGVPNQRILRVPHRAALQPGDLVTITTSAVSPGLVGSVFSVAGEEERSYATYRRFVLRGSSWESATTGE